ncbi:MAG: hypothetical protein ACLSHW_10630 [Lachnospiraceae bacterium]
MTVKAVIADENGKVCTRTVNTVVARMAYNADVLKQNDIDPYDQEHGMISRPPVRNWK